MQLYLASMAALFDEFLLRPLRGAPHRPAR